MIQAREIRDWALELAMRATREQGRFLRSYAAAVERISQNGSTADDPLGDLCRFAGTEIGWAIRGGVVGALVCMDAAITASEKSNGRFEKLILSLSEPPVLESASPSSET